MTPILILIALHLRLDAALVPERLRVPVPAVTVLHKQPKHHWAFTQHYRELYR